MTIEPMTALGLATLFVTGAAQKSGESLTEGAIALSRKLWELIRNRLGREQPKAVAVMAEVEREPQPENLKRLERFLAIELEDDPAFAAELSGLAVQIQQAIDHSDNQSNTQINISDVRDSTVKTIGKIDKIEGGFNM
jgi:hypothetical protein